MAPKKAKKSKPAKDAKPDATKSNESVRSLQAIMALESCTDDIKLFIKNLVERNRPTELKSWTKLFENARDEDDVGKVLVDNMEKYWSILREEYYWYWNWLYLNSGQNHLSDRDASILEGFLMDKRRRFQNEDLKALSKDFKRSGFDKLKIIEDKDRIKRIVEHLETTIPKTNPLIDKEHLLDHLYDELEDRLISNFEPLESDLRGSLALNIVTAIARGDLKETENSINDHERRHGAYGGCVYQPAPYMVHFRMDSDHEETLLHLVARSGNLNILERVILDVPEEAFHYIDGRVNDFCNENGQLPIHIAIEYGNVDIVGYFLKFGRFRCKFVLSEESVTLKPEYCSNEITVNAEDNKEMYRCIAKLLVDPGHHGSENLYKDVDEYYDGPDRKIKNAVTQGNIEETKSLLNRYKNNDDFTKDVKALINLATEQENFLMVKTIADIMVDHNQNGNDDQEKVDKNANVEAKKEDAYVIDQDGDVVQANDSEPAEKKPKVEVK